MFFNYLKKNKIKKEFINNYDFTTKSSSHSFYRGNFNKSDLEDIIKLLWEKYGENRIRIFVVRYANTWPSHVCLEIKQIEKIDYLFMLRKKCPLVLLETLCIEWNYVQRVIGNTEEIINFEDEYLKYKLIVN